MHTNNTPHYNLPQFIGSDIPNPLTDWNDSMQAIDNAMYEIKTQADEIGSDIVQDESDISDLQSQANLTDDNITLLNQQTTAARSAATDAQDAANRNATNITALQQSVANNRTSITQYNSRFNQNVPFAFGIEEVEDPDNPGQTIDQYGFYTNDDPSEFVPFGEAGLKTTIFGAMMIKVPLSVGSLIDDTHCAYNSDIFEKNGTSLIAKRACTITELYGYNYVYGAGTGFVITVTINGNSVNMPISNATNSNVLNNPISLNTGDIITVQVTSGAPTASSGVVIINLEV